MLERMDGAPSTWIGTSRSSGSSSARARGSTSVAAGCAEADEVYEHLLATVPWQASQLFRYDHVVEESRVGSWWARGRDAAAAPGPRRGDPRAPAPLRVEFDGFAMLQYRDGTDGQAFHRDTDMRYLEDTIIAVLSLGATRPWCLRPRSAAHTDRAGQGRHPRPRSRPPATCS